MPRDPTKRLPVRGQRSIEHAAGLAFPGVLGRLLLCHEVGLT
jgi:hypothetical protein